MSGLLGKNIQGNFHLKLQKDVDMYIILVIKHRMKYAYLKKDMTPKMA